jgi:hypothetical protein
MGCLVCVQSVKPLDEFTVRIAFEDGMIKEIDLEPYFHGPIFEPIRKDSSVFRSVKVEGGTIAWDNGADIDLDVLYHDLKPARMEPEKPIEYEAPNAPLGR